MLSAMAPATNVVFKKSFIFFLLIEPLGIERTVAHIDPDYFAGRLNSR